MRLGRRSDPRTDRLPNLHPVSRLAGERGGIRLSPYLHSAYVCLQYKYEVYTMIQIVVRDVCVYVYTFAAY